MADETGKKRLFLGIEPRHHLRNFASLIIVVLSALFLKWGAKDIIWGLWASSLSTGYLLVLIGCLQGLFMGKWGERIAATISAAFLIPFFTVHFGGFHIGHAAFLMDFFPVNAPADSGAYRFVSRQFAALGAPPRALPFVANLAYVFQSYWIVVAATFVSRFHDFRKIATGKSGFNFMSPYVNVVRMHLLIFVFAGLNAAHLDRLALSPVLLFYFFPWGELLFGRKKKTSAAASADTKTP